MYSLSIITDNSQTKYFFFSDVQLEDVTCGLCLRQLLLRLQCGKSATKGEDDHLYDYIKNCIGTEDTCDGDVLVESFRQIILLIFHESSFEFIGTSYSVITSVNILATTDVCGGARSFGQIYYPWWRI